MKILFTWELGGGLGHLVRDLPIALELQRRGHEVTFAVQNLHAAHRVLQPAGVPFVQSPILIPRRPPPRSLASYASYADMLGANGFREAPTLTAALSAWMHTYALLRPDVVVCDFSPAALLAARVSALAAVQIGSGFEVPPVAGGRLPSLRASGEIPTGLLDAREMRVLRVVNGVCKRLGLRPLQRLAEMYDTRASVLLTAPEVDCFAPRRRASYLLPDVADDVGEAIEWPAGKRRVFVYLRAAYMHGAAALEAALARLERGGDAVIGIVPDAPQLVSRYASDRMRLRAAPVRLASLLPQADLAVTNAGSGLLAQCLMSGVPVLGLPFHLEQRLSCVRAERTGAVTWIARRQVERRFGKAYEAMTDDARFKDRAETVARRYRDVPRPRMDQAIADIVERAARSRK